MKKTELMITKWDKKTKSYTDDAFILENHPQINDFLNKSSIGVFFKKVGIIKSSYHSCGYTIVYNNDYKGTEGVLYVIVVQNYVIKIGQSSVTLQSRFNSYSAGIDVNRTSGTASTTNYVVSKFLRDVLKQGLEVEIYAYELPTTNIEIKYGNETLIFPASSSKFYEARMIKEYQSIYKNKPILSLNT
jgi:hypothetical protein